MNQIDWMPDTLQEGEKQVVSSSSAKSPWQQEKKLLKKGPKRGKNERKE